MRRPVLALVAFALVGCAKPVAEEPTLADTGMQGETGDPRNRARLRTELAAAYYGFGNFAVALEELRLAVAADPNYAPAYGMYGVVYMALKENRLADQNFERALRLAPQDPELNHNYGWFLCQTGREEEGLRRFAQALRNPLHATPQRSHSAAGSCALRLGRVAEAEEHFVRALKLDPDDPQALLQLGQIRFRQGKDEEAQQLVGRFNRLVEPTAESLWLALRIARRLGERAGENALATQLRRRFPASPEYQRLQRGEYDD